MCVKEVPNLKEFVKFCIGNLVFGSQRGEWDEVVVFYKVKKGGLLIY